MALADFPTFPWSAPMTPLTVSNGLLSLSSLRVSVRGQGRVPTHGPLMVVSNHRSILDAPLLMHGIARPVRFVCHHYMSQVPGLREVVMALGCLPLGAPGQGQTGFFRRAWQALKDGEAVGIFPEGGTPMVQPTLPNQLSPFHPGFAHLALRAPVDELVILPVAIAVHQETRKALVPLRWLSWFDASEPLFQQPGWHPAVIYQAVTLHIGRPVRVDDRLRSHYRGRRGETLVADLTDCCQEEIALLLKGSLG